MIYDRSSHLLSLNSAKPACSYRLQLTPHLTLIGGDSASGKTLLWNSIKNRIKLLAQEGSTINIACLNDENTYKDIPPGVDLVIWDNFYYSVYRNTATPEHISQDTEHDYIIFYRGEILLRALPYQFAYLQNKNGTFSLVYPFPWR